MPLSTYSDLTTSIFNWLGRPGDTNLPVDDFVLLFEIEAGTRLKTHFQETQSNITTVGATASYNLPATFVEMREVSITSSDPIKVLSYMPPSNMDDLFRFTDLDRPVSYTLEDTQIRFGPVPDGVYTIRLEYFQSIPGLQANGSNWLYTNYPHIYLKGSLLEAALFLGGDGSDNRYQTLTQERDSLFEKIRLADRKYRSGAQPLQMKIDLRGT